ncbi:hypothetical protein [Nevskia sp.]|uniref:hypothetical protein n=1 Tax=Nevskia sp. TaxID=1929292 RepID=UPI0025DE10A7|nr:hypothetical protein [Nevskia sp.]
MADSMIDRLRRRLANGFDSVATRAMDLAGRESFSMMAELPGQTLDAPLLRLKIEMLSEELGDGGRFRFRAHVQAHLASALTTLPPPASAREAIGGPDSRSLPAAGVGRLLRMSLKVPALRRAAAPLIRHDINSWIEVRASTADLVDGARALLPESEQLRALGIDTTVAGDGPLAQTWAGSTGGLHPGFAQVSLIHVDKRHLPKAMSALLGPQPFQLVAAVVNVAEEKAV